MGKVLAVCTSPEKGTPKTNVGKAELIANYGLAGDAHAGVSANQARQVSLISFQKIEGFRAAAVSADKKVKIEHGAFGENLVVDGIDFKSLPVKTFLECADVVLQITQIGKECHSRCSIFNVMGDCIMPREGVFARVIRGGFISVGDEMKIRKEALYRVWIITASDKGFKGEREDISGSVVRRIAVSAGYADTGYTLLSDDKSEIENELKRICDNSLADVILTTGGTGFSPRDCMPEAVTAVAHRLVPGIPEAMRIASFAVTKRAMLSRSVAAIRGSTLIINLPGSPKAAQENLEYIISELHHGLDILTENKNECGEQ
jgi:molybdenum cofactor synthesis domain-containing protein